MSKLRHIGDGLLVSIEKSPPTDVPAGYTRDPGNPFLFNIIIPTCKYRLVVEVQKASCKCKVKKNKCSLDDKIKTKEECATCDHYA